MGQRDDDALFCWEILPRVSRTFALSIETLPLQLCEPVRLAYLLCRIVDTIEDQPSETLPPPPMGHGRNGHDSSSSRRQGWFDSFDALLLDPNTDPGGLERDAKGLGTNEAESLLCARSGSIFRLFRDLPEGLRTRVTPHIHDMSLGMRMYSARADQRGSLRIRDTEDLGRYCYFVAGTVGEMLTELFELHVPDLDAGRRNRARALASHFGVGLQIVNILKDVAEDAERGSVFLPVETLCRLGTSAEQLLDPDRRAAGLEAIRELSLFAREKLEAARRYTLLWPLPAGEAVRLFCAVPLLLAQATLDEVEHGEDTLRRGSVPKVSRARVAEILDRVARAVADDQAFGHLLSSPSIT
jgi:farnesyl-diphosphate farnesyltransferase